MLIFKGLARNESNEQDTMESQDMYIYIIMYLSINKIYAYDFRMWFYHFFTSKCYNFRAQSLK